MLSRKTCRVLCVSFNWLRFRSLTYGPIIVTSHEFHGLLHNHKTASHYDSRSGKITADHFCLPKPSIATIFVPLETWRLVLLEKALVVLSQRVTQSQITRFTWPPWGPPGSCRPQVGPILTPRTLLSGRILTGHWMGPETTYLRRRCAAGWWQRLPRGVLLQW